MYLLFWARLLITSLGPPHLKLNLYNFPPCPQTIPGWAVIKSWALRDSLLWFVEQLENYQNNYGAAPLIAAPNWKLARVHSHIASCMLRLSRINFAKKLKLDDIQQSKLASISETKLEAKLCVAALCMYRFLLLTCVKTLGKVTRLSWIIIPITSVNYCNPI